MTYKQFKAWCNDRACDGMWGVNEFMACRGIMEHINQKAFWKQEKEWQICNRDSCVEKEIIVPINKRIKRGERTEI